MMCLLVVALGNRHQSTHQVSRFFSRSEGLVVLACGNSAVKTDGRLQLKCNEAIFYMESPLPATHFLGSSPWLFFGTVYIWWNHIKHYGIVWRYVSEFGTLPKIHLVKIVKMYAAPNLENFTWFEGKDIRQISPKGLIFLILLFYGYLMDIVGMIFYAIVYCT